MKQLLPKPELIEWVSIPKAPLYFAGYTILSIGLCLAVGFGGRKLISEYFPPPAPEKVQTSLVNCKGEVVIRRGSTTIPAVAGMGLEEGDCIQTGSNAAASLKYIDNSVLKLEANSTVLVKENRKNQDSEGNTVNNELVGGDVNISTNKPSTNDSNTMRSGGLIFNFNDDSESTIRRNPTTKQSEITVGKGMVLVTPDNDRQRVVKENRRLVWNANGTVNEMTVPEKPTLKSPANLTAITIRPEQAPEITFSWKPVSGSRGYKIQVSELPFSITPSLLVDRTVPLTVFALPLKSTTAAYFWRVAGIGPNGKPGLWSDGFRFQVVVQPDLTGRPIRIDQPSLIHLGAGLFEISGQTEPGVILRINGIPTLVDNAGKYDRAIELPPGTDTIQILATSPTGRKGQRIASLPAR